MGGNNELVKVIHWNVIEINRNKQGNRLKRDLKELKMDLKDLQEMSKAEIRNRVREVDKEEWQVELENLKSLKVYRDDKKDIKEEGIYENSEASKHFFKARTNSLELNSRTHFLRNGNRLCDLCEEEETLEHFLLNCEQLETKRNY